MISHATTSVHRQDRHAHDAHRRASRAHREPQRGEIGGGGGGDAQIETRADGGLGVEDTLADWR